MIREHILYNFISFQTVGLFMAQDIFYLAEVPWASKIHVSCFCWVEYSAHIGQILLVDSVVHFFRILSDLCLVVQ